ncbi:MAG: hypothetical protein WBQ44_21875 [Rhodococcus sp. (in: high G+C Gram-positive bacteria)]
MTPRCGPGICVFEKAFTAEHAIAEATALFEGIIEQQHALGVVGGDHFAKTAVNVVNPGGAAQNPHRDYHLGFMSTETAARFRAHRGLKMPADQRPSS